MIIRILYQAVEQASALKDYLESVGAENIILKGDILVSENINMIVSKPLKSGGELIS